MKNEMNIWSPVIVACLNSTREYQRDISCHTEKKFRQLEDIKVRLRSSRAEVRGNFAEVVVMVELISVLEDFEGRSHLVSRQESLKDRIPIRDFDYPQELKAGTHYVIDIDSLDWDGELKGKEIYITIKLNYTIIAVRDQVVKLPIRESVEAGSMGQCRMLDQVQGEISRVERENETLKRKLFVFERDILSLRRGIQKVENRNMALNQEVNHYQVMVQQLREAIKNKDLIIGDFERQKKPERAIESLSENAGREASLGSRIKRLFLNNS